MSGVGSTHHQSYEREENNVTLAHLRALYSSAQKSCRARQEYVSCAGHRCQWSKHRDQRRRPVLRNSSSRKTTRRRRRRRRRQRHVMSQEEQTAWGAVGLQQAG